MANFEKGTRVVTTRGGLCYRPTGYGSRQVPEGSAGVVTSRVDGRIVSVKFDTVDVAVRVSLSYLVPEDPNAPRSRRLGETPEGMLSPLDPRLSWLWDDAAAMADKMRLCGEYDKFALALGVPGRPKDYTVTTSINGFTAKVVVKARSQAEADKMVLGEASVP